LAGERIETEALMDEICGKVLLLPGLQLLIDLLRERGWTVVGPTVRGSAVVHAEIESVDQLPRGVGDRQDGGSYRLRERGDEAVFRYAVGPQGWKSLLFPSRELLWSGQRTGGRMEVTPAETDAHRLALLGVRSCDLHAIGIQDNVLANLLMIRPPWTDAGRATMASRLTTPWRSRAHSPRPGPT